MSDLNIRQEVEDIGKLLKKTDLRVHFTGVGGVGMYSLYENLRMRGFAVSGSDRGENEYVKRLILRGEKIKVGHRYDNPSECELLIYNHAIDKNNPELLYAREKGIKTATRAALLGAVIGEYKRSVGVSGTHGKSTVTAMLFHVLSFADIGCDVISGASLFENAEPYSFCGSDTVIYEACEYKDSFLRFFPEYSIFLNLEYDHADYFKSIEDLKASFIRAGGLAKHLIINADDANLRSLIPFIDSDIITFGSDISAKYRLCDISENDGKYSFSVRESGGRVTKIALNILGDFNVYNALAAFSLCSEIGIDREKIKAALESFFGIARRLEYLCEYKGHSVYYDYAHHPSEISGGIKAIAQKHKDAPIVIFRPHTYSRTDALFDEFAASLSGAKRALILDIDGVREENKSGISSSKIAEKIGKSATRVTKYDFLDYIDGSGSPIIIMGAADVSFVKEGIMNYEKGKPAR